MLQKQLCRKIEPLPKNRAAIFKIEPLVHVDLFFRSARWSGNEPDFDRVMRHFYPREIPKGMEPKSAPKGDRTEEDAPEWEDSREQPQGSRGPDPEVEWTEEEEWEEDWASTDREDPEAEETAPETPAPSHLKKEEQDNPLDLEALGIYEDRVERVEAAGGAPPRFSPSGARTLVRPLPF